MKSNDIHNINICKPELLAFDFDGVLTNNKVLVSSDGKETVICSRADGLAFDYLNAIRFPTYVVSTERNKVVRERCKKLGITVFNAVENKLSTIKEISKLENIPIEKFLFIGNDLNDYEVMNACGLSACPADSHPKIKAISDYILKSKGGEGVARELLEDLLKFDLLKKS